MLKEALQWLIDNSQNETLFASDGHEYSTKKIFPIVPPLPKYLEFHTLDGLIEYAKFQNSETCIIHVESEVRVSLISKETDLWEQRTSHALAVRNPEIRAFAFDHWIETEDFNIMLQALFVPTDERTEVLTVVGNISAESAITTFDDGVTQSVGQRAGIVLKSKSKVPNPVVLVPQRTFAEVEQPASPFILRVRQATNKTQQCALFEADGGRWRLEAAKTIQTYLKARLPEGYAVLL